uniref:Uncharacterized protein n=1 Tax=Manihot esculenta TaxID=3983 RepID=A0A251J8B4_MANES
MMFSSSSSRNYYLTMSRRRPSKLYGPDYDYESEVRIYGYGQKAPRLVAWIDQNAGRRFYACSCAEVTSQ